MSVSLRFAWYDLWVGAFYDRKSRTLYVCPLPTVLLTFKRRSGVVCRPTEGNQQGGPQ